MPCSLGVIGLGRMAQAIIEPLLERKDYLPENILGVVGHESSLEKLSSCLPKALRVVAANDHEAEEVWKAPIQILAVKPQQLALVQKKAQQVQTSLSVSKPLLVSLLAGVTLSHLKVAFPHHRCIRVVPNAASLVSDGLTGLAWSKDVSNPQRLAVKEIFQPISKVFELPEEQLDSFLALTSSGPAYIALIAEGLADGAVASGLPRALAYELTHRTLAGSAKLLKDKELHPGQLKDMVASPGGTTIAALRHLEKAGVRSALMEAVVVAAERSREMA